MTVKELIEQLQKYPQYLEVVQAVDPEGNAFDECVATELGYWEDGEYMSEESHDDELESDGLCMCQKVVCIWP